MKNNTWDDLVNDWNHIETGFSNSPNQMTVLREQLKSRNKKMVLGLITEVLFGGMLCSYIIYELIIGLPSVHDYILYAGFLIVIVTAMLLSVSLKLNGIKNKAKSSLEYVSLLFKQSQMTQKTLNISKVTCIALFLLCFGVIMRVFILWLQSNEVIAKPILALSIILFVGVLFPAVFFWINHKQKVNTKYQKQLKAMINEIKE